MVFLMKYVPTTATVSQQEFAQFANDWNFKHSTGSPRYPQANGDVERAVRTVKNLLKKEEDPTKALLAYRATPLAKGYSPAELLMGRKIKSTIPTMPSHLKPQLPKQDSFKEKEEAYRLKQKKNFDDRHRTQTLTLLQPEAIVYVTDMDCTGTVTRPSKKPTSYLVNTPSIVVRRNRVQLKNIPIETNKTEGREEEKTSTQNISSRPKRIKTLSLKARENLGLD